MRRLFLVSAKLLGVWQAYNLLFNIVQACNMMLQMLTGGTIEPFTAGQVVGFYIFFLLSAAFAWLLLFRTDQLADLLRFYPDEPIPPLTQDLLLSTGAKLMGLYLAVYAIPSLITAFVDLLAQQAKQGAAPLAPISFLIGVLQPIVELGIGVALIAKTRQILSLITRYDKLPYIPPASAQENNPPEGVP